MWRIRPFTAAGVALTILGILVLIFDWSRPYSFGIDWGIAVSSHALLCTFPICGLIWEWPPKPPSASSIALFAAILAHWPFIGVWMDRHLERRQRTRVSSPLD